MRPQAFGQREHLGSAGDLEVEDRRDRRSDRLDVGVLNVPAVLAEMRGDPVGARALADRDRLSRHWLLATPCLPHGRDVIDVDVEALMRHVIGCPAKRRHITFAPLSQETTK